MNQVHRFASWRRSVWIVAVLVGLCALAAGSRPALALPDDPADPPPVEGEDPYDPPLGGFGFEWSVRSRFGWDNDNDGMIDYHWDAQTATALRARRGPASPRTPTSGPFPTASYRAQGVA